MQYLKNLEKWVDPQPLFYEILLFFSIYYEGYTVFTPRVKTHISKCFRREGCIKFTLKTPPTNDLDINNLRLSIFNVLLLAQCILIFDNLFYVSLMASCKDTSFNFGVVYKNDISLVLKLLLKFIDLDFHRFKFF